MESVDSRPKHIGWLVCVTLVKLILTFITFDTTVPSGIIIPALDGGAFFGCLVVNSCLDLSHPVSLLWLERRLFWRACLE
jgi:H+/Cl- antiporter ClcA